MFAYSLDTGRRTMVIDSGTGPRYLPTGHLVYAANGALFAVRFDPRTLGVAGPVIPLLEGVRDDFGLTHYAISATGSLAFIPGRVFGDVGPSDIAIFDRQASVDRLNLPVGRYESPRVSPDGKSIAFGIDDGREQSISIYPLAGGAPRRLTFDGNSRFPVWSPDGHRIAYQADRDGSRGIFAQDADGARPAVRLIRPDKNVVHIPDSWSPDGKHLLISEWAAPARMSLSVLSIDDQQVRAFDDVQSAYPINATFSPNGRWIAYQASVSGSQVFVRPFPPNPTKYQVTRTLTSSHHPVWTRDGRELLLVPGRNLFGTIAVTAEPSFTFSPIAPLPKAPFYEPGPWGVRSFDVLPDGRIVAPLSLTDGVAGDGPSRINVVLNWIAELTQRTASR